MTPEATSAVASQSFLPPRKKIVRAVVNTAVRLLTGILCKVEAQQLERVPLHGPLIVIVNHVNFLELPILYPRVKTKMGTGFSKSENWRNPFFRLLFGVWDVIPINRDEVDITAMRRGLEALQHNRILFITPEGTRSHHGRLQQGKPGVVFIAQRSHAPILPIACYGGERFHDNIKRLRRTEYHVAVGRPFYIETHGARVNRAMRQEIVDEMMCQIAALMPPRYRGVYADMDSATTTYLRFEKAVV